MPIIPTPPTLRLALTELPRATRETSTLLWQLRSLIKSSSRGKGQPILTLPGYGGGDGSMLMMRYFLNQLGYNAVGLELGRNVESAEERIMCVDDAIAFREKMTALVAQRVETLHRQFGQPVTLLGWSMGGCYALDVSQVQADKVNRVITLGAPFGDPRGTSTWDILRWLNKSDVPVETQNFAGWLDKRHTVTPHIPMHIIYSPNDGIVAEEVARLPDAEHIEHIELDSSHVAFAWNPQVYQTIAEVLAAD
jgi:pimeloyl-ACP methyl ester carboxylesterase